jgi:hypothetical protein
MPSGLPCRNLDATPSQHRADPGKQRPRTERLREIVIGAEIERLDFHLFIAARRDDDDGHRRSFANPPADLKPIDTVNFTIWPSTIKLLPSTIVGILTTHVCVNLAG